MGDQRDNAQLAEEISYMYYWCINVKSVWLWLDKNFLSKNMEVQNYSLKFWGMKDGLMSKYISVPEFPLTWWILWQPLVVYGHTMRRCTIPDSHDTHEAFELKHPKISADPLWVPWAANEVSQLNGTHCAIAVCHHTMVWDTHKDLWASWGMNYGFCWPMGPQKRQVCLKRNECMNEFVDI